MPPLHLLNAHFIFLVHGFMGNPDELYYAEDAIKRAVVTQAAKSDNDDDDTNSSNNPNDGVNNIITHRVTCNNNKTFDGIVAGGTRVAKEVQDFITNYMKENHTNDEDDGGLHQAASISFIGYSLGCIQDMQFLYCHWSLRG